MAQRLIKVAKELNVGTATIVEFLVGKGYTIENKPTAKVDEDMHRELMQEYQGAMAVKVQADQIQIGNKREKEQTVEPVAKSKPEPKPEPKPVVKSDPTPAAEDKTEAVKEVETDDSVISAKIEDSDKPKLKVLGKIDLTPKPKKVKEEKKEEVVKEEVVEEKPPKAEEKAAESDKTEAKESGATAKTDENKENIIRADRPQLKGLKILGKVDASKLKPSRPKKDDKKTSATDEKKKRRRKRKKITAQSGQGNRGRNKPKKDEVKEISKKEIEEQIKATMARLGGGGKNKRQKMRRDKRDQHREKKELLEVNEGEKKLEVTEFISVSDLASLMNTSATEVIMTCMNLGVIVSINQRLDAEIIELVAEEFEYEVTFISAEEQMDVEEIEEDAEEDLEPRAPIVTVMGHVDHGKTSLLDYIRSANVASGEAGGITQHIGAYEVSVGADNKKVTFLDTPGHEAFTAMRARGAKVTDIAVIIVAADDRIMPQTKEAISHAQAAGVPIVFAINKIDKAGSDPERIKQELASMNLLVEDWGGKFQSQDISAKTGLNIDKLLEKIVLEAELLELKANPDRLANGTVIEASLDKGRGYVTKVLVQNGTLRIGDPMLVGDVSGRVKAMFNERGKKIKEAGPATPLLMLGLSGAPAAGENFRVMETEQEAKSLASKRSQIIREQNTRASKRISLDEIGRRLALGTFKELNLIVKGDVDGSIEALSDSLIKLSQETVVVNVIHKAVGQIIESDVLLASASDAIIVGFQVRPSSGARNLADKEGVQIKTYSIIYEAIDEIKSAIEGMLEPTKEEKVIGQIEVRETYKISKVGTVAGCYVQEGRIGRNSKIRIIRDGIVIYPIKEGTVGELSTLKRFKDDAKEVRAGLECGLTIKNFNDIKVEDTIEAYEIHEIKQTLVDN